jgi:tetratricopeptide (TPR) repeat protein
MILNKKIFEKMEKMYTNYEELDAIIESKNFKGALELIVSKSGATEKQAFLAIIADNEDAESLCDYIGLTKKQAYIELAEFCIKTKEPSKAAEFYERAGEAKKAKECYIKLAEGFAANDDKDIAGDWYEKAGEHEKAKECWLNVGWKEPEKNFKKAGLSEYDACVKAAEVYVGIKAWWEASECYKRIGLKDKAKECLIKLAEFDSKNEHYRQAAEYYEEAGLNEKAKECWIDEARKLVSPRFNMHDEAVECYTKGGFTEQESIIRVAADCLIKNNYCEAAKFYAIGNYSLSDFPKDVREKMLELVKDGNVTATQNIARTVKSEEDEVIFNEARAGLVL